MRGGARRAPPPSEVRKPTARRRRRLRAARTTLALPDSATLPRLQPLLHGAEVRRALLPYPLLSVFPVVVEVGRRAHPRRVLEDVQRVGAHGAAGVSQQPQHFADVRLERLPPGVARAERAHGPPARLLVGRLQIRQATLYVGELPAGT